MNASIEWVPIPHGVYLIIREWLMYTDDQLFGTFTDMDGTSYAGIGEPYHYTEWGIKGASLPTVKYERKGNVESFFLAKINIINED